ncbi:L-gulonolactone D-arabinono-1,4-lactone oxidase [Neolentinus lepideus HHB14362 ss-1]|uniref:D-arabinono-1,4-lactone oxidase n=1 Tax=Neolentinus lepideus HHB14362 ss-1 TaxID=1314782 RepID=A0A165SCE7_9AGAM|nr:L-gulonolactone D-arabinono-1,4-lactone oxidase [Neolentinus lepideus HHB14362 ss-1]
MSHAFQRLADIPLSALCDLLGPITVPLADPRSRFSNWAKTYGCTPATVFEPTNEYECELVLELARREGKTVRAAGVGHSPSDLACTSGYMVRTDRLCRVLEVNSDKRYVVAQPGITLHSLHDQLAAHHLAMINVGSISDQSLAGIITTATHGSGITYGVISTHVLSLVLLLADGSRVRCSRQDRPDLFMASICGLGTTGLILSIQLEVEPAFRLKETQYTIPFDQGLRTLDELVPSAEHVRLWWFPQADALRVSAANRTSEPKTSATSWFWNTLVGYHVIQFLMFLGRYIAPVNIWTGRLASWLSSATVVSIDDSYRIFNLDCKYLQYTTEWAVPYDKAKACLYDLRSWLQDEHSNPRGLRPHFPIEIRFTEADDIWLSPSNGQRTCWIGIIQYKPYNLKVPYRKLFERFENVLRRHGGRPHWAKAHPLRPEDLRQLYPRFHDFIGVLEAVDPHGMFRNEYAQRHLFGRRGPEVDDRVFKSSQSAVR